MLVKKKKKIILAILNTGAYNIIMKTKNKQELIKKINAWERARKNVKVGSKMYMNISSRIHRLNLKLKGVK